jgi:hypothetical protein
LRSKSGSLAKFTDSTVQDYEKLAVFAEKASDASLEAFIRR